MDNTHNPDITLVVPCHNEEGNVALFLEETTRVFGAREGLAYEVVFVDDGSSDGTLAALRALVEGHRAQVGEDARDGARESVATVSVDRDAAASASSSRASSAPHPPCNVRVLSFSRNFGKESAIYAGMQAAAGNALCLIDADLQQDPAIALDMYDYLVAHDDCDVVAAYQADRRENKLVAWLKGRFYKAFNATSDEIELPENMSDFRVFTRQVADALLAMPEHYRFSKGLFAWVGFKTHAVPYTVNPRNAGESSWSTRSLFKYAFTGISSFSTWPLKALKRIGGLFSIAAAIYLLYVLIVDYCIKGIGIPGYPTLVCLILLFGGFQLLALGLIGDYLARGYIEGKHRPLFIVKEDIASRGE